MVIIFSKGLFAGNKKQEKEDPKFFIKTPKTAGLENVFWGSQKMGVFP